MGKRFILSMKTSLSELLPPSVVFPDLKTWDSRNQGLVEAYIDLNWLPFWNGLSLEEKAAYLDRWQVSEEWRREIAECYDADPEELAAEARESEAYLAEWRKLNPGRTIAGKLRRLLGL